jgi:hypothetical protein
MHDDRFDIPTRDDLIAALDKLLETPRAESDGGWAEVSFERMHELDSFFRTVRKAVLAPDPDGASVITWEMLHRAHHFNPVPGMRIAHRLDTPEKIREALQIAASLGRAAGHVADRINAEMRMNMEKA